MASKQKRLSPARAGPQYANLAIQIRLGAQPCHRAFGVADDLSIGNATFGAHLGGDIIWKVLAAAS
jgi:hypothetical protein